MADCKHEQLRCRDCLRTGTLEDFVEWALEDQIDANTLNEDAVESLIQAAKTMHMEDEFDARSEEAQTQIEEDWKSPSLEELLEEDHIRNCLETGDLPLR